MGFEFMQREISSRYFLLNLILLTAFFLLGAFNHAFAQSSEQVQLTQAGELEGLVINGKEVRRLKNNVIFKQGNTTLYCDSAYMYVAENNIEAFGKILINKGDSVEVTGDKLLYSGATRKATILGDVFLKDNQGMTLKTKFLDYDFSNKSAHYINGGVVKDKENTLTSEIGSYNTVNKQISFKKNVVLINPKYQTYSDTLIYNTINKTAYFKGPTHIKTKDGNLYAEDGEYNTIKGSAIFKGRARIEQGDYVLEGNKLNYNEKAKIGHAEGNVIITSKKDSILVYGDHGYYDGYNGFTRVHGHALMRMKTGKDTLLLKADTLISINDSIKNKKQLLAYRHVRIFKSDLQGKCDSLVYNMIDSTIYFYQKPVLWSNNSQLSADSIRIKMKNNQVDKMFMKVNAFIISEDSIQNHNQVKGRAMLAQFKQNKIQRVDVNGNGESIYFALEKDSLLIGLNKIICSNMVIRFKDNTLNTFSFLTKPDANFIPPHEIAEPDKELKGFRWRIKETPKKEEFIR